MNAIVWLAGFWMGGAVAFFFGGLLALRQGYAHPDPDDPNATVLALVRVSLTWPIVIATSWHGA